jgi:hypothetical protein
LRFIDKFLQIQLKLKIHLFKIEWLGRRGKRGNVIGYVGDGGDLQEDPANCLNQNSQKISP